MEKVQVRFTPKDLRKIEKEGEEGNYTNKSEAIVHMREATVGLEEEDELVKLRSE